MFIQKYSVILEYKRGKNKWGKDDILVTVRIKTDPVPEGSDTVFWYSTITMVMLVLIGIAFYSYQKKMNRYHLELQLAFKLFEELMEEVAGNINLDLDKK